MHGLVDLSDAGMELAETEEVAVSEKRAFVLAVERQTGRVLLESATGLTGDASFFYEWGNLISAPSRCGAISEALGGSLVRLVLSRRRRWRFAENCFLADESLPSETDQLFLNSRHCLETWTKELIISVAS